MVSAQQVTHFKASDNDEQEKERGGEIENRTLLISSTSKTTLDGCGVQAATEKNGLIVPSVLFKVKGPVWLAHRRRRRRRRRRHHRCANLF